MRGGPLRARGAPIAALILGQLLTAEVTRAEPPIRDARERPLAGEASPSSREVVGSLLAVVSLAAAGAGAYLTARVDRLSRDIEQARTLDSQIPAHQIDRKVQAGERAQRWQWVGYGAAVAAGAGAALLLLWPDRDSDASAATASASPLVGPTLAGASLSLRF